MTGLGVLAGGPGSGNIQGSGQDLDWQGAWAFSGVSCIVGGLGYADIRVFRYGAQINVKA